MIRKIIIVVLGILIIVGASAISRKMSEQKPKPPRKEEKVITSVFAETVQNSSTPITISTNGTLMAYNRLELFSEVTGVFERTGRGFDPGEYYKRGATLIRVNSDEHRANIRSQKSSLYNQLVQLLPDLRLDYIESFPQWDQYIKEFDMESPVVDLPDPVTEREKLFIGGKNILTTFYNIKNLEERLRKFVIRAPFSGMLTNVNTKPGSIVSPGQNLGTYISTNLYELEVAVGTDYMDLMQIGKSVQLHNVQRTKTWKGKVARVNGAMNAASQTVRVFIQVKGKGLVEGMYLEADITAKEEKDTYEVDRKLLVDNSKLYAINDSKLELVEIDPVFFKEKTAIVKGLANGQVILSKSVPGSFNGMGVKIIEN